MHFKTLAASVLASSAAIASAQSAPEEFTITGLSTEGYPDSGITWVSVDFRRTDGLFFSCVDTDPMWPNPKEVITCRNKDYTFALHPGTSDTDLRVRLYHSGSWGEAHIPIYCTQDEDGCDATSDTVKLDLKSGSPPDFP